MKKQIIAAAVAATLTSVAFADISITGAMKANYKQTETGGVNDNNVTTEADLVVTGKTGDTEVRFEINSDSADSAATAGADNLDIEDQWMATKIGDARIQVGTWNGSDSILSADSARGTGKWMVDQTISGVALKIEGSNPEESTSGATANHNGNVTVQGSGTVMGQNVTVKIENAQNQYKLSGEYAGVNYAYHTVSADAANSDKTSIQLGTTIAGIGVEYVAADADSSATITGDSWFGDAQGFNTKMTGGDDLQGIGLSTSIAGNKVTGKIFTNEVAGSTDIDFQKLIVTRPLAGGTTLEVVYTDEDAAGSSNDKTTVDVELAVKF
jgi:hypothetical protein